MASFIAKQLIGDQLGSVKEAVGDKKEKEEEVDMEAELEAQKQREEEERKRKEKHTKMEIEREKMRQGIRDKYKLEKHEEVDMFAGAPGGRSLGRDPNTPVTLPGMEDDSMIPKDLGDLKNKMSNVATGVQEGVSEKMTQAKEQCVLQ